MANLIEYCHISQKSRAKKAVFDQIISNKLVRLPSKGCPLRCRVGAFAIAALERNDRLVDPDGPAPRWD